MKSEDLKACQVSPDGCSALGNGFEVGGPVVENNIPQAVLQVLDRLHQAGHEAYIVGGAVRDMLLGLAPQDWDVATSARPEEVMRLFRRVIPSGLEFGTVTVLMRQGEERLPIEVTTYRAEGRYSAKRHPEDVKFGVSLEEDLSRRDFEINALAYDPLNDNWVDPYGALQQLGRGQIQIKAVGQAQERFHEDPLRMLRAISLWGRLASIWAQGGASEQVSGTGLPLRTGEAEASSKQAIDGGNNLALSDEETDECQIDNDSKGASLYDPEEIERRKQLAREASAHRSRRINDPQLPPPTFPPGAVSPVFRISRWGVVSRIGLGWPKGVRVFVDPLTYRAISECREELRRVSAERIRDELTKILLSLAPAHCLRMLISTGLGAIILPELEACRGVRQGKADRDLDVFSHILGVVEAARPDLILRLAALTHDLGKPACREIVDDEVHFYGHDRVGAAMAGRLLKRLRFSNEVIHGVTHLVSFHMFNVPETESGVRRLMNRVGEEWILPLWELRVADLVGSGVKKISYRVRWMREEVERIRAAREAITLKSLAVNGHDVMDALGLKPGPLVGQVLNWLLDQVLEDPTINNKEKLLALAKEFLAQRADPGSG
ncbi:MAG: CCA tRNA nucleotidyltransferase [Clostridia bacterium]|nr:CCA tRNA nucleotidyltransferase [Clostridia bacterium]